MNMNVASIAKKIIIKGELITESPLRIGSGSTDNITDLLVLKNKDGKAFIPGTSLAGVLRKEVKNLRGMDEMVNRLFGYVTQHSNDCKQSIISVSDVIFNDSTIVIREGVGIDRLAGTAIEDAKFNFEAIDGGAVGNFEIEITVRQQDLKDATSRNNEFGTKEMYEYLATSIADILTYGINVGSSTSKGFGKVRVNDECINSECIKKCKCYLFDFASESVCVNLAKAWVEYLKGNEENLIPYYNPKGKTQPPSAHADTFVLNAEFHLRSSLLVRDYDTKNENESGQSNLTAVQMKCPNGDYLIPGTSVKGVIRSCATKILLDITKSKSNNLDSKLFDKIISDTLDQFMGSKSLKSRLSVDEIYIPEANLHSQEQTRNRIDRFTGGTIESALFTEKPVWRKFGEISKTFKMCCRIHNCQDHEAGLMLLVLREMWLGNVALGGGKAIGRGVLEGFVAQINYKGDDIYLGDIGEKGFDVICKNDENKDTKNILETYVKKCVEKVEAVLKDENYGKSK